MSIRIYSPEGGLGVKPLRLVPGPDVLAGLRIGLLDNRKPNAAALLGHVGDRLAQRTGAKVAVAIAKSNAAVRCEGDLLDKLRAEADVVITGSGD